MQSVYPQRAKAEDEEHSTQHGKALCVFDSFNRIINLYA